MKKLLIVMLTLGLLGTASADFQDGLVGYWPFDVDGSDASGNGVDCTASTANVGIVQGLFDNALDTSAGDGAMFSGKKAADLNIDGNKPRTVSSWVNLTGAWGNGGIYDVGTRSGGQDFSLRYTDNNANRFRIQYWGGDWDFDTTNPSGYQGMNGPDAYTFTVANNWVHFVHTHDGERTKIYADGNLIVDWEKTINTGSDMDWRIGVYGGGDEWAGLIDDIALWDRALSYEEVTALNFVGRQGQTLGGLDWAPTLTAPAVTTTGVLETGTVLSWDASAIAPPIGTVTKFDVYLNKNEPNRLSSAKIGSVLAGDTLEIATGTLEEGTTYFWQVDAVGEPNVASSAVWSFKTIVRSPYAVTEPASVQVFAGESTTLTFEADSEDTAALDYQWYMADGTEVPGAIEASLTLDNIQADAAYYCIASNSYGSVQSATANIQIKLKLAHWDFESESIQSIVPGSPLSTAYGSPQFVEGKVGNGMQFKGSGDIVSMAYEDRAYFDTCNSEMTVAAWVKVTGRTGWNGYISREGESGRGWQVRQRGGNGRACFTTRDGSTTDDQDGEASSMLIDDGQWRLIVATYSVSGGKKKLYVNGAFNREDNVYGPIKGTRANVALGGRQRDGGNHDGYAPVWLDEVQIFNWAMTDKEIAEMYVAVETEAAICVGGNPAMDYNGDCKVGIADLAIFLEQYLYSNTVPERQTKPYQK